MSCRPFFAVLALAWFPATVVGKESSPEDLVGCYGLHFGSWDPERTPRFDTLRHLPPPRIRLDTAHVEPGNPLSQFRVVRPAPGSRPSRHRFSGWTIVGDTEQMGWSTGFLGVRMVRGSGGGDLFGHAGTFSDAYIVQKIRLKLPEGADVESLRERLEDAMEPAHGPQAGNPLIRAAWEDVTTSLTLASFGGRVEVLISDPRLY